MDEIKSRSPYWLSPGIDVPTRDELLLLPTRQALRGFYVDRRGGEAAFVPTDDFMRESPLWRIDLLDDIADAMLRTRTHALVAFFQGCQARGPDVPMAGRLKRSVRCARKSVLSCRMSWRRCWCWISSSADER